MTTKVHVELNQFHTPVQVHVEELHTDGSWNRTHTYPLTSDEDHVHQYVHKHRRLVVEEVA